MCKAMSDKRAFDITIINVEGLSDVADAFIIASGKSAPQVKAIFDNLEFEMEKQDIFAKSKEGVQEGRWIAVDDCGSHVDHKIHSSGKSEVVEQTATHSKFVICKIHIVQTI